MIVRKLSMQIINKYLKNQWYMNFRLNLQLIKGKLLLITLLEEDQSLIKIKVKKTQITVVNLKNKKKNNELKDVGPNERIMYGKSSSISKQLPKDEIEIR